MLVRVSAWMRRRSGVAHTPHQLRGFLQASRRSASFDPSAGDWLYSQRAVSGRDIRIDSIRPPVFRPNTVPCGKRSEITPRPCGDRFGPDHKSSLHVSRARISACPVVDEVELDVTAAAQLLPRLLLGGEGIVLRVDTEVIIGARSRFSRDGWVVVTLCLATSGTYASTIASRQSFEKPKISSAGRSFRSE